MRRIVAGIAVLLLGGVTEFVHAQVDIRDTVVIKGGAVKSPSAVREFPVYILERSTLTVYDSIGIDGFLWNVDLVVRSPWSEVIIPNALNNAGKSWTSRTIEPGTFLRFAVVPGSDPQHPGGGCRGGFDPDWGFAVTSRGNYVYFGEGESDSTCLLLISMTCGPNHLWLRLTLHRQQKFDHFDITFRPDTVAAGDTTKMIVQAKDTSGNDIDFPGSLLLSIYGAAEWGTVLGPDGAPGKFDSITYADANAGNIRFVARETEGENDHEVIVTARTEFPNGFDGIGDGPLTIKAPSRSILLGESIYYYAIDDGDKLAIRETTDPTKNPGMSDITFTDPVAGAGSGKNPVYWEYKYPIFEGGLFKGCSDLPEGMIRLVGRYWENGKTYTTRLTAHSADGRSGWTDIEVKKPGRLGNDYRMIKDVFGNDLNIDELIIKHAGRQGVPPQIVKADIEQESTFRPAYRWEPFVDAKMQSGGTKYMDDDFRYKKTLAPVKSEGDPRIPRDHTNVRPISYPLDDYSTIWERLFGQSSALNPNASVNRYPPGLWYSDPAREWRAILNSKYQGLLRSGMDQLSAKEAAREFANEWLRDEYLDGVMSEGIAQTRSAASYGLMQLLYSSAVEFKRQPYPFDRAGGGDDHLPEYINVADTNLTYSVPFLLSKANDELYEEGDGVDKPNEWTLGFERTFIVALNMYNGKAADSTSDKFPDTRYNWHYGFNVLEKSIVYSPLR